MTDIAQNIHNLVVFQHKAIRRVLYKNEWWFVVADVVQALTGTMNVTDYVKKMRLRDKELSKGWGQIVTPLLVPTPGGEQKLNCATAEGLFRIIQSIPSPKAEPFKRWLAKVGYERVQEIENPELATQRTRALFKAKGYPDEWIEKRMRGIAIREELTEEWKKRGVQEGVEYAILTDEIAQATFGLKTGEHRQVKGLKRENLRDHMTDLELIFSMLGEASTTAISRSKDAQGLEENRHAAKEGGKVAGDARKKLELQTGQPIVSASNYLPQPTAKKGLSHGKKK